MSPAEVLACGRDEGALGSEVASLWVGETDQDYFLRLRIAKLTSSGRRRSLRPPVPLASSEDESWHGGLGRRDSHRLLIFRPTAGYNLELSNIYSDLCTHSVVLWLQALGRDVLLVIRLPLPLNRISACHYSFQDEKGTSSNPPEFGGPKV